MGQRSTQRWLFRDLDLDARPGTLTAVVGPNGAGKSTLLRALGGLLQPDHGTVELGGKPLAAHAPRARAAQVAYLPQSTPLMHDFKVDEVVMLGRLPHLPRLGAPRRRDVDAVADALDRVDATALSGRRISTLSGGERQRVMLARMLATEAQVLLLDEPTAALDIRHALDVLQTLATLRSQGPAIVVAMHDLPLADAYATHAVCLGEGDQAVGTRAEVLTPDRLAAAFGVEIERDPAGRLQVPLPPPPPPPTGGGGMTTR